jgi:hypothetical protein
MNSVFASLLVSAALSAAPSDGMWKNDYAQALEAARSNSKPLLVVLHKPNEPKQAVQQVAFSDDNEQAALLKNYELCQVDVSTPEGEAVAKAFGAKTYPYTVITNKTAKKVIFRKAGAFSDGQWTTTLVDYRKGVAPVVYSIAPPSSGNCPNCR